MALIPFCPHLCASATIPTERSTTHILRINAEEFSDVMVMATMVMMVEEELLQAQRSRGSR